MTWIQGTPSKPGFYWVELSDQGGWPGIRMCEVMLRWLPVDSARRIAASKQLRRKEITIEQFREEFFRLEFALDGEADTKNWEPITALWNCNRYIPIPKPVPQ